MQEDKNTVVWFVDLQRPDFGDVTIGSIKQGISESKLYGKTGYMDGSRLTFPTREEALQKFHEVWPDRDAVELHCFRKWSKGDSLAFRAIEEIYGTTNKE